MRSPWLFAVLASIGVSGAPAAAALSGFVPQEGAAFADGRLCKQVMDQGPQSAARADLDRAVTEASASKQLARAAFLRGCQLFSDQKPDKADDEFEKAVKLEDRNAVYHFWLGRA